MIIFYSYTLLIPTLLQYYSTVVSCSFTLQCSSIQSNRQRQPRARRSSVWSCRWMLEVSRLMEGPLYLASVATNNLLWRDKALHDKKIVVDFVLMSAIYVVEPALSTGQRKISWWTALVATSHGLGMALGTRMVYLVQRAVALRRTRLTPCARPRFFDDATFFGDLGKIYI